MKKKVLISLGIIIIVGAVAGGILFTGGKEKDNSVNAMASIETASTVESEPEEKEESKEIEIEDTESESEEQSTEDMNTTEENDRQKAHQEAETPKETTTNDELTDITPLDKTMYAKGNINTRTGPSTEYTKAGNLTLNESVHVTGQSQSTAWYQLTLPSGEIVYCSNQLLSDTKTEVQQSQPKTEQQTNNNNQQQPTQPEQPSTPPTNNQDTPSTGGIEQGNLGGDNGFAGVIGGGGTPSSDWLGTGSNTPGH